MGKAFNALIKILLLLTLLGIFGGLVVFWLFYLESYSYILEGYFYIWLSLALLYGMWNFKLKSKLIFLYGLIAYSLGSIMTLFNFLPIAQFLMRSALVFFIMGLIEAFLEYRKNVE